MLLSDLFYFRSSSTGIFFSALEYQPSFLKDQNAVVENGKIKEYRVTGKVSFELDHNE